MTHSINEEPLILNDDYEEKIEPVDLSIPPKIKTTSTGVKICGVSVLFIIAAVIGSVGHAAYDTVFHTYSINQFVTSAALVGGTDFSVDVCTDPWNFMCGLYDKSHYIDGSAIGDMSIKEWKQALNAYTNHGYGQSKLFFEKCKSFLNGDEDIENECASIFEKDYDSYETIWRIGYPVLGIATSRMANPYKREERLIVIWPYGDTTQVYPEIITLQNDPCNLVQIFNRVACFSDTSSIECQSPRFLLAGSKNILCERWKKINENKTIASLNATNQAKEFCMTQSKEIYTPLSCFLLTSQYYPDTNYPYLETLPSKEKRDEHLQLWFDRAKTSVLEVVKPLGSSIQEKIKNINMHSSWTSQNLPTPPVQLNENIDSISFTKLIFLHDKWKTNEDLRQTTYVYPRWEMNSWAINAYYSPATNEVFIPDAMSSLGNNYVPAIIGTILFIIGHELGHSFDPTAFPPMNAQNSTIYRHYVNCLKSNYTTENLTIGEDWADFIGMEAMVNYMNKVQENYDIKLKEMTITTSQQVLIAFGQFWCSSTDKLIDPNKLTDVHSLPTDRVRQAVIRRAASFGFECPAQEGDCTLF